jgi:hypothetical protein
VWTRSPEKPTTAAEAISSEPQTRADSLTAKTLFASDIMAANDAWAEKEVTIVLIL